MHPAIVRRVLYPAHERLKGKPTFQWLQRLEGTQWWSRERLLDYQAERLRLLVAFAVRHVPYYARLFAEHGMSPDDVRAPQDLRGLPFLTRADVRECFDALRARAARRGVQ